MSVREAFVATGVRSFVATAEAPLAEAAMIEFGITTQLRGAAFLAQVLHESGRLQFFEELASGEAYEGRRDLGNTQPGDGRRFKGRGPIQLTGRSNYRWASQELGIDLVSNPGRASEHKIGWRIAGLFWRSRGLNGLADAGDFQQITRRINGGFNRDADRRRMHAITKKIDCRPRNRWAGYTASEQRWIKEYDALLHRHENRARRQVLRIVMRKQAERIRAAAQTKDKGGDGRGWKHANRTKRYRSLRARSSSPSKKT